MKAVVLRDITNSDDIVLEEIEIPKARKGWVLVKILAFGMNHSELVLRVNEIRADYISKPVVPGIECVGIVEESLDEGFEKGDLVCSLMGGLGRNFNGSYEEYAVLPVQKLFHICSNLDAAHLAAIPETFFTAWGSLFECLNLQPSDTLLVRGATSALGYAAMQIATALGCKVYGTTHKKEKMHLITDLGCNAVFDPENKLPDGFYANKILELIGPKTIRNSLSHLFHGGIVCNTGILGGEYYLNGFDPIKEIPNGCYLTGFFSNFPTQETIDSIFAFIGQHNISPFIGASFRFSDIKQAIKAQEKGVDGKIVVVMD